MKKPENTFKKATEAPKEAKPKKEFGKKYAKILQDFSREFYTLDYVQKNLGFVLLLTFIGAVYIWNSNQAEKQVRYADKLKSELKELKSECMTASASLSKLRKQSEVSKSLKEKGIEPIGKAPYRLVQDSTNIVRVGGERE